MRGSVWRKLGLLGVGLVAILVLAGVPSLGQGVTDPQGEISDGADCYGHHKAEGFRSMDLYPLVVSEVPKGQVFTFEMTVRNPWLHELQDVYGYVDISNAPGLGLEGGRDPVETASAETISGGPTRYTTREFPLKVEPNATELVVRVAGDPGTQVPAPFVRDQKADYDLYLTSPDGAKVALSGLDPTPFDQSMLDPDAEVGTPYDEIRVPQLNLTGNEGDWKVTVAYRGYDSDGSFAYSAGVYYNVTGVMLVPGPELLMPNEEAKITFRLKVNDVDGLQRMRYGGIATAHHEHTDRNIGDLGDYDKWNTMQFATGSELRVQGTVVAGPSADTLGPVIRRWSQVLGFAGSFLIIPSLVMGGTFGKTSVVKLNAWFGGPRRRVLFHNSMSFWLLGIALLHMFLFLYEVFWNWSHGLVWGGLSLACMIGLGVTGATQRSFVARWGFNRWRFVHFAMGTLIVVFVLVHLVADGSHFAPIREALFGADT